MEEMAKEVKGEQMNTWEFVNGDVVLHSEDEGQLLLADMWIKNLIQAIRVQVLEEVINGRNVVSNEYEQPELPEVPC
jgi:hypothetical protein